MASSYKGLYVERDSAGRINSVWVDDGCGNVSCLPPSIYLEKEVAPSIASLPDKEAYRKP